MNKYKILVIGAHPDDAEIDTGGTTVLLKNSGHEVEYLSLTNGNAGHHQLSSDKLASRRLEEAQQAGKSLGVKYDVWDINDGMLEPDVETRFKLIRYIRQSNPDIIITHCDSEPHPDHKAANKLVIDSAFLLTVPLIDSETKPLERKPIIMSWEVSTPEFIVNISNVIDKKAEAISKHESQVFEWLPFNKKLGEVPKSQQERIEWIKNNYWCNKVEGENYLKYFPKTSNDKTYLEGFKLSSITPQEVFEGMLKSLDIFIKII